MSDSRALLHRRDIACTLAVLIGDPFQEDYDCEFEDQPRLAIGRLGSEVRDRWVCRGCRRVGAVAYVENYRSGQGSTYALCETCLWERLSPRAEDAR